MNYKNRIIEIDDEGTTRTRCFTGKPCRVIKNRISAEWETREAEIEPFPLQVLKISEYVGENVYEAARLHGRIELGPCAAGQSSVLIRGIKTAGEVVEDVIDEAELILTQFDKNK